MAASEVLYAKVQLIQRAWQDVIDDYLYTNSTSKNRLSTMMCLTIHTVTPLRHATNLCTSIWILQLPNYGKRPKFTGTVRIWSACISWPSSWSSPA